MSDWSDTFRDRHYSPGYVYIAGSLSHRVMKVGTTVKIGQQERRLRREAYGSIDDWVLLYYVWVAEERGRIEHDARRILKHYQQLRMYDKEGRRQKAREIVSCRFGIALRALTGLLDDAQRVSAIRLRHTSDYEFGWTPPPPDPPIYALPVGLPLLVHLYRNVDQLELSMRTSLCLKNDDIRFIGDLVRKSEAELLRIPNFGRKSLNELKEFLARIGLHLGMDLVDARLEDIDALSQQASNLLERVDELELSVRSANCLKNAEINYVFELVQKSEAEMLHIPNFGRKSLNEIKELLHESRLYLGMNLPRYFKA